MATLTVSALARRCGLSRSTVLYYEQMGLLRPAVRTDSNYRSYGPDDERRLRQICLYRGVGLKLENIRAILDRPSSEAADLLERRLGEIDTEVARLRDHQRVILALLGRRDVWGGKEMVTKDKWVSIMQAAGFSEDDMHRWHAEFERAAPDEHQEFLEFIHVPKDEARQIREWSRTYRARA